MTVHPKIHGPTVLKEIPMDVPELVDLLHKWFDDDGDADTLRETVEMVINERKTDAGLDQASR